jgi:hypothetical protein
MRTSLAVAALSAGSLLGWLAASAQEGRSSEARTADLDRTVLPPPVPEFKGRIGSNYKESTPDFRTALPVTAPNGAPNILLVVLDDVGYGQLGRYGGPIGPPNIDKLVADWCGRPLATEEPYL